VAKQFTWFTLDSCKYQNRPVGGINSPFKKRVRLKTKKTTNLVFKKNNIEIVYFEIVDL